MEWYAQAGRLKHPVYDKSIVKIEGYGSHGAMIKFELKKSF